MSTLEFPQFNRSVRSVANPSQSVASAFSRMRLNSPVSGVLNGPESVWWGEECCEEMRRV